MSPQTVEFFRQPTVVELLRHCRRSRTPPGTQLMHRNRNGDHLFLILRGSVSVLEDDGSGRELILAYLNAGDFVGELGLFGQTAKRSACIQTRSMCDLAVISYRRFSELQRQQPSIIEPVVAQLTHRLREANDRFRDIAFEDVRGRVTVMLEKLAQQPEAMTHPDGMQLKITRIELGRLVGCSREMVGRVLRDMEADEQISARGKRIVLHGAR